MTTRSSRLELLPLLLALATTPLFAGEKAYDFKDPKGVNNVTFLLDSEIEPIMGVASDVAGNLKYDAANPAALQGNIVVDATSLHVANAKMKDYIHGEKWMNTKKHAAISFKVKSAKELKRAKKQPANTARLEVTGDFSCHGVTKELKTVALVTYLPGKLGERMRGKMQGDLLVLRAKFTFKRSDYGVGGQMPTVADKVDVSVAIVGMCPQKQKG